MHHQVNAVAKIAPLKVGALYMEMGTGKTRTTIELAKLRQHKIDRVVWFCPVSVKRTIAKEFLKHTTCKDHDILLFGNNTNSRTRGLLDKFWVIVGIESMSSSVRTISAVQSLITEKTMVVVDESTYIKGHRSYRTRRTTLLAKKARYRMILTGTPMTQGVVDLFTQMYFLSPTILGYDSFYTFAHNHLEYEQIKLPDGRKKESKQIRSTHNTDYLAARIAPYAYQVTKAECLDLPKKVYTSYSFDLSETQQLEYLLAKQRFAEKIMNDDEWNPSSVPVFQLFTELQSIVCGFLTLNGKTTTFEHDRVKLLEQVVSDIDESEKVVIWGKYHHCIDEITESLIRTYGENQVAQYHGLLSESRRAKEVDRWASSGRFLVGTQAAGGHGLNELVVSSHVIFYANGFKYSERLQAEDRTHRIGQTKSCWYADLCAANTIDDRIESNLATKGFTLKSFMQRMNDLRGKGLKAEIAKMIMQL